MIRAWATARPNDHRLTALVWPHMLHPALIEVAPAIRPLATAIFDFNEHKG
jgi:hypothetical protein